MMGDTRDPEEVRAAQEREKARRNPHSSTRDSGLDLADPEQVEPDTEQAERFCREREQKKPAA